jgi:hypothetical protein
MRGKMSDHFDYYDEPYIIHAFDSRVFSRSYVSIYRSADLVKVGVK